AQTLVPVISLASLSAETLKSRVEAFIKALAESGRGSESRLNYRAVRCQSALGGGSLPGKTLASYPLEISPGQPDLSAEKLSTRLRQGDPPVVSVIQDDRVLIDFRTVLEHDTIDLMASLKQISQELS